MRQLHLVGFTSDHDGLVLAGRRGAKSGGYVVSMDEEFLEQLDHARRTRAGLHPSPSLPDPSRSRIESALSPREMQTRMRAGRTVAQVAAEAGVPLDWVERFAAPVLAEQAAAVERAQQSTMRTQRRGYSDRALGPSVLRNLADRGIRLADDEFDQMWTAFQLAENEWVIRFRYRWRGRDLDAEWLLDEGAGSLTPGNRQATELGFVDPGRHAPAVKGLPPMRVLRRSAPVVNLPTSVQGDAEEVAGEAAAPTRKRARRAPAKAAKATKAPRRATMTVAKKASAAKKSRKAVKTTKKTAAAKRPATRKVTAKKVTAKRAAVKKVVGRKPAVKKTPAKKAPAKKAPAKKVVRAAAAGTARRERPLKAVRVQAGRVSRNGSATATGRSRPASRAGGNGSRRSGG